MTINKKLLSMILSLTLVSSVLPTTSLAAYADDLTDSETQEEVTDVSEVTEEEVTEEEVTEEEVTEEEVAEEEVTEEEVTEEEVAEEEVTEEEVTEEEVTEEEAAEEEVTEEEAAEEEVTEEEVAEEVTVTSVSDVDKIYAADDYTVEYKVVNQYSGGYNAEVIVTNTGSDTLYDWNVKFALNGEVRNLWNGEIVNNDGNNYLLKNTGWNRNLKAGESITVGIAVGYDDEIELPESCTVVKGEKASVDSRYDVDFDVLADWESGYTGQISITNNSNIDVEDWTFEFDFDSNIEGFWDAQIVSHEGNHYVIKNVNYNKNIKAGQTLKLGFTANPGNVTTSPENFDLYGQAGNVDWSEILNVTGVINEAGPDGLALEDVNILVDGEYLYRTDSEGHYNIPLTTTVPHTFEISKDGYIPVVYHDIVAKLDKLNLDDITLIPDVFANTQGPVRGNVVDRATGVGIPNATVNIRTGINNTRGEIIDTVISGEGGAFTTSSLLNGTYTIEVKGENIETYYLVVYLAGPDIPVGNLRVVVKAPVGDLGKVNGSILAAGTNEAVQGAVITVDGLYTYTSDADGKFSIDVTANENHTFVISKDGYITVKYYNVQVEKNEVKNLLTILEIPQPEVPVKSTATGRVTSALNGSGMSGITIVVREGMSNQTGDVITTLTSASDGSFSIPNLEYGNYTLELKGDNIVTAYYTITCFNENQQVGDLSVTPKMNSNQMRIVLTWGANPADLDSHLTGPNTHVFYQQKTAQGAVLDVDDVTSYGPETVTLDFNTLPAGTYTYYVLWYAGNGSWPTSNCKVTVYSGESIVKEYYVPNNLTGGVKSQWNVFTINTQTREITSL